MQELKTGDEIKLEFIANKIKGAKPIARSSTGKICVIGLFLHCRFHLLR